MKKVLALLLAVFMVMSFAACTPNDDGTTSGSGNGTNGTGTTGDVVVDYNTVLAGDYGEITLWVSDTVITNEDNTTTSVVEIMEAQIAAFQKKYPDIKFTVKVNPVGEGDAASKVIEDVASAPDIYCFAQDQLARLVQAGALVAPTGTLLDGIKANNTADSVNAASVAGTVYAYPLTADNGYFMYYDTSIFSEEDVEDLATLVAKCEANDLKFRMALEDAWINSSFFFATGCANKWTMDQNGKWTGVEDNYNSDKGLAAMKGMQILAQSTAYESDANVGTGAGVWVTGTWNSGAAATLFGENLGVTDLPSFTVDGETYHLGSFYGCKLMGVKPQSDAMKGVVLQLLAEYLTNEENQLERHEIFGWGPSNAAAQESEAVKSDIVLQAYAKQQKYATLQGNINGSWWDIAKVLGAQAKNAKSDADLEKALSDYEEAVKAILNKSEEELAVWSVIGSMNGDTNWTIDYDMTKQDDGSYLSEAINFVAGDQFKVRQGHSWDVNYGANGVSGGDNIVVETAGTYRVKLTVDGTVTIELIAA